MATDERAPAGASTTPPKVIGLGAPISVWIDFDVSEIPALIDAIGDEFARHGGVAQIGGRTVEPPSELDAADWRDHVGELQRMLGDVEGAAEARVAGSFAVLWSTVVAYGVVRGAVSHAERRASAAAADDAAAALDAVAAARRTLLEFKAIDDGGLLDVWL